MVPTFPIACPVCHAKLDLDASRCVACGKDYRGPDGQLDLVVASDANPGTAPSESLPLALSLAVRLYGLTTEEALLGATRNAALSLREAERGAIRPSARADFVAWDLPHEDALMQPWGVSRASLVVRDGRTLHEAPRAAR